MRIWLTTALVCAFFGTACSSDSQQSGSGGGGGLPGASGGSAGSGSNPRGGATSGGASSSGGSNSSGGASGGNSATSGGSAASGGNNASGGSTSNASGGKAGSGSGGKSSGGSSSANSGGSPASGGNSATSGGKANGGSAGSAGANNASGGAATVGCSSTATGYKMMWHDEFDGPAGSAVDPAKWTHDIGGDGWGNNELEYYTDGAANAALDGNGNLVITAKKQTMNGKDYTSARLKTLGLYQFTYGRIEGRMKIPAGQGLWPAFWMLGNDINTNQWPACGEIDIMENIGKEPNIIHATIHGPGYSAGNGPTKQYSLSEPVANAFHVFAIEWEEGAIRWYVDDMLYSTKTKADIPSSATWVYSHPFFLLLNVAVGGGWPGSPDSTTMFPQTMTVDYVRVCQK